MRGEIPTFAAGRRAGLPLLPVACALLMVLAGPAAPARADAPEALGGAADETASGGATAGEGAGPAPAVPLERLLELPSGFEPRVERRSNVSEAEWRERFRLAREELERARSALRQSKAELARKAEGSEAWSIAPPIGAAAGASNEAPLSYELRQRINRQEAAVERAERRLRDLEIEANLAEVPEAWRR